MRKYNHESKDLLEALGYSSIKEILSDIIGDDIRAMAHGLAAAVVLMSTQIDILVLTWALDGESVKLSEAAEIIEQKLLQLPPNMFLLAATIIAKNFRQFLEYTFESEEYTEEKAINDIQA